MGIKIIIDNIQKSELAEIAKTNFNELVKAVVDVEKEIMAIGGDMHADEEKILIENGSKQQNLWGINFYPEINDENWIEFDSMINIRPGQGNRSRGVDDVNIQNKIRQIVSKLVK